MSEAYVVAVEGLAGLSDLTKIPEVVRRAAQLAVNRTVDRAKTNAARNMRDQVNFPARYLSGQDGRLTITKRASRDDLEAVIRGRHRPTSLARFMSGGAAGQAGVTVSIKPGFARFMPRAFAIRLRAGTSNLDTKANLGLAVRTRDGERPRGAYKPAQLGENLWLLYGPSVDQVFRTVAGDIAPETADQLEAEFSRLLDTDLSA